MTWPKVYEMIFNELWEQIKRTRNLSEEQKPHLPELPAKAQKLPPEDRKLVQAFTAFVTMNYKIELDIDEINEEPTPEDTPETKVTEDPKPIAQKDREISEPSKENDIEKPDNSVSKDSDYIPVLNAEFMSDTESSRKASVKEDQNDPQNDEIEEWVIPQKPSVVTEFPEPSLDQTEDLVSEQPLEPISNNWEQLDPQQFDKNIFAPPAASEQPDLMLISDDEIQAPPVQDSPVLEQQEIENKPVSPVKKETKKVKPPEYPEPPEAEDTDLDWAGMCQELFSILTQDMPDFIKDTQIKDFLKKRQNKMKDAPHLLMRDTSFISELFHLTKEFGINSEVIPALADIHENLYQFLTKIPGVYVPDESEIEQYPKLFKTNKAASSKDENSFLKFLTPAFYLPRSQKPRITSEVLISDTKTTHARAFIQNNTPILKKILRKHLSNLPDVYFRTFEKLEKAFNKKFQQELTSEEYLNTIAIFTELSYFFASMEYEDLFNGIMLFTDYLGDLMLEFDIEVFPRLSMPFSTENMNEFENVQIAEVPDTKPVSSVLRIKRRGIKHSGEMIKNAVILISDGESLKELSRSLSLSAQLLRSPIFYSSGKRSYFENVSKFDEYLLKFLNSQDRDSIASGFLRDLINHIDEINHPTGFPLSKPLLTMTDAISSYMQRRYGIEEFKVNVGGNYDASYSVKKYKVQRVRHSGQASNRIVGQKRRGFARTDGTFLQGSILWVSE